MPIIRSIVSLATELDLMVIAEGVETLEEIERLQQLNCQFAQGFAFGAAMIGRGLHQEAGSPARPLTQACPAAPLSVARVIPSWLSAMS